MDLIGISGLAVSIAGFALSLWQIKKTRTAAEAAKSAADETVLAVRSTHSVADIQEICGRSRHLFHLIKGDDPTSAAIAAFELREQVARLHATKSGRAIASNEIWEQILHGLGTVHDRLETAATVSKLGEPEKEKALHQVAELHIQFSTFAATAADSGGHHEHTQ